MALYITEYGGFLSGRQQSPGFAKEPAIQTQVASSGTTSTIALSAGTSFVRLMADANVWILFTSSGSTVNATSTNTKMGGSSGANLVIPPEWRYVNPSARLVVLST